MSTFDKKDGIAGDENKCYIGTSFSEMNGKSAVLICIPILCTNIMKGNEIQDEMILHTTPYLHPT